MNPTELGRRLREARETRRRSRQAAAEALGIARTAITQMEAGNRSVSTLELAKLAELYQRPVTYFFEEAVEAEDVLVVLHRVAGQLIEGELRSKPRSQYITFNDVALVAHHFGVSYQAAMYRLKSLRYLSSQETDELLAREEYGRTYLSTLDMLGDLDEPEERKYWDRELRNEIAHLAIEAYRRNEISRGRLLELGKMLGIQGTKLLDLAEAARGE